MKVVPQLCGMTCDLPLALNAQAAVSASADYRDDQRLLRSWPLFMSQTEWKPDAVT